LSRDPQAFDIHPWWARRSGNCRLDAFLTPQRCEPAVSELAISSTPSNQPKEKRTMSQFTTKDGMQI
jgi:hypothetical protein